VCGNYGPITSLNLSALPEDGEFQYFLAVAETQKSIEDLKVVKKMSEKNLESTLNQLKRNECLILDIEERKKKMRKEAEEEGAALRERNRTAGQSDADRGGDGQLEELQKTADELDQKIRATKIVYKEMKHFLGEFLVRAAPGKEHGSVLASLMQDLYSAFVDKGALGEHPDAAYVKLSHLDYDVDEADVAHLLEHGLIERHPAPDDDRVRLVNFTE